MGNNVLSYCNTNNNNCYNFTLVCDGKRRLAMILLITIVSIISFITLALLGFILGRISVKDNATEARIFIKTGLHINKPVKGKISAISHNGISFKYNRKGIIFVPTSYKEHFYCGKRILFLSRKGVLIASPFEDDIALSNDERESLIYELCASHIGADGMRALKGKGSISIIIIALVAFIIGVSSVIGFNAFQNATKKQSATQQQSIPANQNKSGIIIIP